ncbi:DUF6640 family protein [Streptoalloteichus hindustanus]|uniref:Uncharacterized protein n=1 Tax=Streptoalloteichus hindustanus TaxID=2017 RepID=A0A1M5FMX3_STRHI|nr:DUF6640 family protein [Streptoalloteichus hindustanus]SHF92836.1 hypothetical protein SAMN05444320_105511 [Streptoalloteichus hindustanus]
MSPSRLVIIVVGVVTAVSAVLADLVIPELAAQHALNPNWPPHAKFHDAQYMVMTALLGLVGVVLALRPGRDPRGRLLCAAAVLATPWLGMLGALPFPGTATYDPEFADRTLFVLGLHGQVLMALVLLMALLVAAAATPRAPADSTARPGTSLAPNSGETSTVEQTGSRR